MSATNSAEQPPQPLFRACLNAAAVTLLGCLLVGVACFVLLGPYLKARMDLYHAAIWWELLCFAPATAIILATIVLWQRARRSSLRALGWGKPAPLAAILGGVALGFAFTSSVYFGGPHLLSGYDVWSFNWVRVILAPVGLFMAITEEIMMRGFFMTELQRARVPTWIQIVASGACTAVYHSLHNPTLIGFLPSFILFSVMALLYVLSRRSLTPPIIAHASMHVLGDPYLLMMALAAMKP